jgi:hypothetical protein
MHPERLLANAAALGRIIDRLRSFVHVAQTARRKSHSGLVSSLKKSERSHPYGRKEYQPPDCGRANPKENSTKQQCRAESDRAEAQAALLPARTDVRGRGDAIAS